jgi:excisionase family DNA binding protein
MEPLAVDIREAARLLSLSARTIRRHIQSGRIKAVRVGRRVLVPIEALTAMVKPGFLDAARNGNAEEQHFENKGELAQ